MRSKNLMVCLSLLCITAVAHATTPNHPNDLIFESQPIDSLCFFNNETIADKIDLKNCGVKSQKFTIRNYNASLLKKGFIGYNWQDPSTPESPGGYSYYQYFPTTNQQYWIYSINSGGGSGEFTAIQLVKRESPTTLSVKSITNGDRCNGGIEKVSEKNGELYFNINLTPYDLIALNKTPLNNVKAYDDLAACATCCIGKSAYTISSETLEPKLNYILIDTNLKESEMPEQGKLQSCFNKLLIANHKIKLSETDVNNLAKQFNDQCNH